jgi:tRNA-dihydrouridine synthase
VLTPEDAERMVAETGCDAVMIGRAAASNPWIFRQIAEYEAGGSWTEPTDADRYRIMKSYYSMLADRDDDDAVGKMKQFATYFTHGVRNGARLRAAVYQAREAAPILDLVDRFFAEELEGVAA